MEEKKYVVTISNKEIAPHFHSTLKSMGLSKKKEITKTVESIELTIKTKEITITGRKHGANYQNKGNN